jgi:ABC-type multidrug transport system fused ATPase/permease subunit
MESQSGLRTLLPYGRPYRWLLIIGTIYAFIGASAVAFTPVLLGYAIDGVLAGANSIDLAWYAFGIIALTGILAWFRYLLRMLTGTMAAG